MAHINRSLASLRIFGDTLDPDHISRLLGATPSDSFRKGDIKRSRLKNIFRKSGGWLLEAKDQEPGNLNLQITEILGQLTKDLNAWATVMEQYKVDLVCGLFMEKTNEDIEMSAQNLKALGERGIKLAISIYAPAKDAVPDGPGSKN